MSDSLAGLESPIPPDGAFHSSSLSSSRASQGWLKVTDNLYSALSS